MASMARLIDLKENLIWHGNVLRLPGKFPYEKVVDFMIYETQDEDRPYGLIVTSGYKAGLILVRLPQECSSAEGGGVRKDWLVSNWEKWVYPDCNVAEVLFIDRYEA